MLELPEHLKPFVLPPGSVQQVAKGVFVVEVGGFYPMFIEFSDFVMAIEAPASQPSIEYAPPLDGPANSSELSEIFLRKIRETIPSKPVRYLVATHYHSDHAGGARAFAAAGATLLTTPGVQDYFKKLPSKATIEAIERSRVISDGVRSVELISVGANPHTDEALVAFLPAEKILYQGDLFYFDGEADFPPRNRVTVMEFFARWLTERKLEPERIYGTHGRGYATMKHVRQILDLSTR
jgi:glyoxylase-like metal-dependent hydrolase (beta-lactamase superfamily II)